MITYRAYEYAGRLLVAMVFIAAGVTKMTEEGRTTLIVELSPLLPHLAMVLAALLTYVELVGGIGMLIECLQRGACIINMTLSVGFIGYHLFVQNDSGCGCLGVLQFSKMNMVIVNGLTATICGVLLWRATGYHQSASA